MTFRFSGIWLALQMSFVTAVVQSLSLSGEKDWYVEEHPLFGYQLSMKYIPAGEVEMCLEVDVKGRPLREKGTFVARVSPFWIQAGEYSRTGLIKLAYSYHLRKVRELLKEPAVVDKVIRAIELDDYTNSHDVGSPFRIILSPLPDAPATGLNRQQVRRISHLLSLYTGKFYRLPTQAEWEYACRAGAKTRFPWGNDARELKKYVLAFHNSEDLPDTESYVIPLNNAKSNAWGLSNMLGSVEEWVADGYAVRLPYEPGSTVQDPIVWPVYDGPKKGEAYKRDLVARKLPSSRGWLTKGGSFDKELFPEPEDFVPEARNLFDKEGDCVSWGEYDSRTDLVWPGVGFRFVRPVKIPSREEQLWHWGITDSYDKWMEFTFEPTLADEKATRPGDR